MVAAARRASESLGDSIALVRSFLLSQQNSDGGFQDRSGRSDLYYTAFGLDGIAALQIPGFPPSQTVEKCREFLLSFQAGEHLDFVHLCCLARCWAGLRDCSVNEAAFVSREGMLQRLESYRSGDGGFHPASGNAFGSAYGAFLALMAYRDLEVVVPAPERFAASLKNLRAPDGAFANDAVSAALSGSTNATAAAVMVLTTLGAQVPAGTGNWLLARAHQRGGFVASPVTPAPDLLSTATALHALALLGGCPAGIQESCLEFVDSLWTNEGGFYGYWGDERLDCEYAFYGLLALGHLRAPISETARAGA
jgi:prenyltransferase beta subunit